MSIQIDDHDHVRERKIEEVESMGFVVIDESYLLDLYGQLREASEGRGANREAAEAAINYLFDVLGEPGTGE